MLLNLSQPLITAPPPPSAPHSLPDFRGLTAEVKDEGVELWILLRATRMTPLICPRPCPRLLTEIWKFELEVLIVLKPQSLLILPISVHLLESRLGDPAGVPLWFSLPFDGGR